MKDQVDALTARGLPATFINSSLDYSEVSDRLLRAERGEWRLLYVAPERFESGSAGDRLRAAGVSLLAVDEAHCISEWGHDFRPSYRRVSAIRTALGSPPTVALTATATPAVRRDITEQLELRSAETVVTGFDRQNLHYHVIPTRNDAEKDATLIGLLRTHPGQAVVYATTRKAVDRLAAMLSSKGFAARGYHAGQEDQERQAAQNEFMDERVAVIVATSAFGMGIDKANVRLVVHHSMPGSLEAYYQEAGRAGRNGQRANCVVLHAFQDRFTHEFFINNPRPVVNERREVRSDRPAIDKAMADRRRRADLAKLDTMQRYAYAKGCRRTFILRYFGDPSAPGRCEGCDNCLGNHRTALAPEPSVARGRARLFHSPVRQKGRDPGVDLADRAPRSEVAAGSGKVERMSDGPLFALLRSLRSEIARRDGVPAFVVFPDRTLVEIAARRPRSMAALADVRGVGPIKLGRYGEQVLAVVRAHDRVAPTRA